MKTNKPLPPEGNNGLDEHSELSDSNANKSEPQNERIGNIVHAEETFQGSYIEIVPDKVPKILIPEGVYKVAYVHHDTQLTFSVPKVYIHFKIIDFGEFYGFDLWYPFNVDSLIGPPKKNGQFRLRKRQDLFLLLSRLYENAKLRPDKLSLHPLKSLVLNVKVRTVITDYRQRPLAKHLRYSVIDKVLDIAAGVITT